MGIETEMQAALADIASTHSDLSVEVKYGSQTATGVRVLTDKQTNPETLGQRGTTISTVRVSAADIDEPGRGALLTVGGVQVYVRDCRTSGGVRVIDCSDTQSVGGV